MGNFVLFSDAQSQLVNARAVIAAWLGEERHLRLYSSVWDVLPNTYPSLFLGYRISRAGVTPSRKLRLPCRGAYAPQRAKDTRHRYGVSNSTVGCCYFEPNHKCVTSMTIVKCGARA
jgi:hypothetical protein